MAFQTHTAPVCAQGATNGTRTAGTVTASTRQNAALVPGIGSESVTYKANGEDVTLSFDDIKAYLCPAASDQECRLFVELCRYNGLNPFLKEAYLIKYDKNSAATMVVGKDAYTKRAEAHPQFDGYEAGLVVLANGQVDYREGSAFYAGEELLGGWAKVYRKDRSRPSFEEVRLEEYMAYKDRERTTPNANWANRPGTMIRKVALVHALREAFPSMLSGLYTSEEAGVDADVEGDFSELSPVDRIAPGRDSGKWARKKPAEIAEARPDDADDPFSCPADDAETAAPGGDAQ